jgi:hypothetical protein
MPTKYSGRPDGNVMKFSIRAVKFAVQIPSNLNVARHNPEFLVAKIAFILATPIAGNPG